MEIIKTIAKMQAFRRQHGHQLMGFVPTMGYLHEGHLSLIRASKQSHDLTVVSIFVNPLQFGPSEDLSRYPRDFERDKHLLESEGVDVLFFPSAEEMYPDKISGMLTQVYVDPAFTSRACGAFRQGHFEGVATVVLKLFNAVGRCHAYFGLKDYQQFILIQRMIRDMNLDVSLHGLPTFREPDGLAMSSRNSYLTPEDRQVAPMLYSSLLDVQAGVAQGLRFMDVKARFEQQLAKASSRFKLQYLECYDRHVEPVVDIIAGQRVLLTAVYLGDVRLIDNVLF